MARGAQLTPATGRANATAPRPERSLVWLQGLLCGVLATCLPPTAITLAILLAPGLVAVACDRSPGRPIARTMLLFGLSATVFPLIALWSAGHTIDTALMLACDPRSLALAWLAASAGWLLTQIAPLLARLALEAAAASRRRRLRLLRDRYSAEWRLDDERSGLG